MVMSHQCHTPRRVLTSEPAYTHGTGVSSGRADRLLLMQAHGCGPRALPASHLKRSSARPALNAGSPVPPRVALHAGRRSRPASPRLLLLLRGRGAPGRGSAGRRAAV